jgi:hypothetical protein
MNCVDLALLRQNATRVRNEMLAQKGKKRSFRGENQRFAQREGGDLEIFLQRRLQKMSMLIERHIAQHCCQE